MAAWANPIPEIVGREEELASIAAWLESGRTAMVLDGEAGIGKSTLWAAGVSFARDQGARILESRPTEAERALAYVGLGDLIEGVAGEVLPALSTPRRHALEAALLTESVGGRIDARALGLAVRDALEALAATARVLVAIDDAQWFDDSSAQSLAFALRRLRTARIAVLLSRRVGGKTTALERAMDFELVHVGPLSVGATQKLLYDRLQRTFPRPTLLRLHETAAGNPFFVLELARATDTDRHQTLARLIGGRLDGLGQGTQDALLLVAAHGRPPLDLLPEQALQPALEAGVVEIVDGTVRFTHPLLAAAVYERASPAARREAHRALAGMVDEPIARVRHLGLSTPEADEGVAGALEQASAFAATRAAASMAAELAELAAKLTPPTLPADHLRRIVRHADYLAQSGDGRRAIGVLAKALAVTPAGTARGTVLVHLAHAEADFVGTREGIARYREALPDAQADDALLAEIHLKLADLLKETADARLAIEHAEFAVAAAASSGNVALRCEALAIHSLLHSRSGLGIPHEETQQALALERGLDTDVATQTHVYQLLWSGRLGEARNVIGPWLAKLASAEDRAQEMALWYGAMLEWRAGNWELASRLAAECLAIRQEYGVEGSQPIAEVPAAMIAAYRGQVEEARDRSTRALARAERDGIFISQSAHRAVLGFIELSHGDPAAALGYLRRGWEVRDLAGLMEPGHRWELADTLEALIAVGDLVEAEQKLREWERRAKALDRSWALAITSRCRALMLAARGDYEGAQRAFERALREHARTEDPFQHARTLLAQGITQRRAMRRGAARQTLGKAEEIFHRLGSPLWASKAQAETKRIGGRAPGRDDLTESERRVAALVAEGKTNQEVAAVLFLGERTVASHLTHIYAKLGIRSRTELARTLK